MNALTKPTTPLRLYAVGQDEPGQNEPGQTTLTPEETKDLRIWLATHPLKDESNDGAGSMLPIAA